MTTAQVHALPVAFLIVMTVLTIIGLIAIAFERVNTDIRYLRNLDALERDRQQREKDGAR